MLLGAQAELGKEFTIAAKRAGQYVIACDKYDNAPAMQVATSEKCSDGRWRRIDRSGRETSPRHHRA